MSVIYKLSAPVNIVKPPIYTEDLIEAQEWNRAGWFIEKYEQAANSAPSGDSRASDWAPNRIWLQREQGDHGSHTWCENSVGYGDIIEESEYVRVSAPLPASQDASDARELLPYQILEVVDTHFGHKLYEIHNSDWIAFANAILAKANGGA